MHGATLFKSLCINNTWDPEVTQRVVTEACSIFSVRSCMVQWDVHISQACDILHDALKETCRQWCEPHTNHRCCWLAAQGEGLWLRPHSGTPHLPCLLQLGRPPLLQDGLHGTDEFQSHVLENNYIRCLVTGLFLCNSAGAAPLLLLFARCRCASIFFFVHQFIEWVIKSSSLGAKITMCVLPHKQSSVTKTDWGSLGSYTEVLRWGVVVIMAFPQLQSQSF